MLDGELAAIELLSGGLFWIYAIDGDVAQNNSIHLDRLRFHDKISGVFSGNHVALGAPRGDVGMLGHQGWSPWELRNP